MTTIIERFLPTQTLVFGLFALAAFTLADSSRLFGQAGDPPKRVEEIRIVGNRRIPESTILY
jgi:hypothetical protein